MERTAGSKVPEPVLELLCKAGFRFGKAEDLIYGFSERTSSEGVVLKEPSLEEMDFLVSKLELNETKQVAIGFLNASKNPTNEKLVAHYFRERGFEVLCSHEIKEPQNEVARWWRAVLNAYITPAFHEFETKLELLKEEFGLQIEFASSETNCFYKNPQLYSTTGFAGLKFLANSAKQKNKTYLAYFGLEKFYCIHADTINPVWQSEFGPVAVPSPQHKKLKVQPTLIVDPESLNRWGADQREVGYEPGPMILGRSLRPTFLDVLCAKKHLEYTAGLTELCDENKRLKIIETLKTLYKGRFETQTSIESFLEDLLMKSLIQDLLPYQTETLLCTGALAPALVPLIRQYAPWIKIELAADALFCDSVHLYQQEFRDSGDPNVHLGAKGVTS